MVLQEPVDVVGLPTNQRICSLQRFTLAANLHKHQLVCRLTTVDHTRSVGCRTMVEDASRIARMQIKPLWGFCGKINKNILHQSLMLWRVPTSLPLRLGYIG